MVRLEGMKQEYTDHFEKLANSALSQYPLEFDRLVFVGYFTNCILLAESGGEKFALRISSPYWRTFTTLIRNTCPGQVEKLRKQGRSAEDNAWS